MLYGKKNQCLLWNLAPSLHTMDWIKLLFLDHPLRVTRLTYGLATFVWFCQNIRKREMVALSETEQIQPETILNLLFLLLFYLKIINLSKTKQLRFSCCKLATSFVLPLTKDFCTSFGGLHKSMKLFLIKTKTKTAFKLLP